MNNNIPKTDQIRQKALSGFLWRLLERTGAQGVSLLVTIVLARLLNPELYGLVALAMTFITILNVFVDSGLGSALVQKKEADNKDFATVFFFNLGMSLTLYAILWFAAPHIAAFYHHPQELTPVIRALGVTILLSGVKNIQQSYVSKHLLFKRFFFSTLGGTVGSAVLGIGLAYFGYGIWALVAQHLFNITLDTLILWLTVKWRPIAYFSWQRLKGLLQYSWKLLASGLLDIAYSQLRSLIIGRLYTATDLGLYNKGNNMPSMFISNINSAITSVLFPVMSNAQDNRNRVRELTRRAIKTSTYLIMPLMMGLAVCAEPIVRIILGEQWVPCVPYMRIACFTYAFWPIHTANLQAIKAMGKSDIFLMLEIIKKVIGILVLIPTITISVYAMALSGIFTSILCQIINSYPNKKLLNYSYWEQVKDMLPQIGLTLVMGAAVFSLNFLPASDWLKLLVQIPCGITIYWLGSRLFHLESYDYMLISLREMMQRKKKPRKINELTG